MSESTERLCNILGFGKKNAVRRENLLAMYGGCDRKMRLAISRARLEGVCINNDQDGFGYYRPTAQDEIRRQYIQTLNRAKTIIAQLKALRGEMGIDGQMSIEDLGGIGNE